MAYTASALSFMLEDLGKTVVRFICLVHRPSLPYLFNVQVLTGAQIPLSQLRNDAADNFLGALVIAGQYIIPGVYYS
jgi:lysophospholipase